jgi:hypothetical protein
MAWHAIPYISNKRHTFNVVKLIATFLFFMGLIGFIVSFANLFHQWDVLSNIKPCFEKANSVEEANVCRDYFYKTTGIALSPERYVPDQSINIAVSFWPIVTLFFWIIMMLLGVFLNNIGNSWHVLVDQKLGLMKQEYPSYLNEDKSKKAKK